MVEKQEMLRVILMVLVTGLVKVKYLEVLMALK